MSVKIDRFQGYEILDSRGRPTVMAKCYLSDGTIGKASVPSGASTGKAESVELRDGDPSRYGGLGCQKAVSHINQEINQITSGKSFDQKRLDQTLIELDGTPNKANLGANAILACSLAFAKACAKQQEIPLFQYFGGLLAAITYRLPRLTVNLFSGGKHAGGQVPIQDLLIVPMSAMSVEQALADLYKVYYSAADIIKEKYGMRTLTADEGGLAPAFNHIDEMLETALESIEKAGFKPGADIALAMDIASSHFYENGKYLINDGQLGGQQQIELLAGWVNKYPIVSLEDGLAEDDWAHWPDLNKKIGKHTLVLGDDLLCTQTSRIQKAIDTQSANALLLKVNQCGSLTDAMEAFKLAKAAGWQVTVSARSGETEDDWLADLAVGWSGDQIKVGSITQSERLAKYNRLLEIEKDHQEIGMEPWKF
ncbi:MAG: phosphopyruvate hydratase [Cyclobacteriaceae bacterium]